MHISTKLDSAASNVVVGLWTAAFGLSFILAISGLWGWYIVGAFQSCGLVALILDERAILRPLLTGTVGGPGKRAFAWYKVTLTGAAVLVNTALLIRWALSA